MTDLLSFPVSMAQQGMWLSETLFSGTGHNHVCQGIEIDKSVSSELLTQAVNIIVEEQESLRTVFQFEQGEVKQQILLELECQITEIDCPPEQQAQLVERLTREKFDLTAPPLFRIYRLNQRQSDKLLLVFHHIITDGWSGDIFKRQMWQYYQQLQNGQTLEATPLPLQYGDYAEWQQQQLASSEYQQALGYWQQQLANVPPCTFPSDKVRPAQPTFQGQQLEQALPADIIQGVEQLARQHQTSAFSVYLSAFKVLISRYTRQQDIVVGSPVAGRDMAELEPIIGYFVNTLVYRTQCDVEQSFSDYLEQVKHTLLDALEYQQLPFAQLVSEVYGQRQLDTSPFFQLMFAYYRHEPQQAAQTLGRDWPVHNHTSKYDLTLSLEDHQQQVSLAIEYSTELYQAQSIQRLIDSYVQLLRGVIAMPSAPLKQVPLLTPLQQQQQLQRFAANTVINEPQPSSLVSGFEQMVAQFPKRPALQDEDVSLTYAELNQQANQLAHMLIAIAPKLQPGSKVAICLPPSVNTIVAILATLKSGAAYVPLDPDAGNQRINYIMDDAEVDAIICNSATEPLFHHSDLPKVCLERDQAQLAEYSCSNLGRDIAPLQQAYMIYTSGSTGKPKGVVTSHHNVVRLFSATEQWFAFNEQDVWSLFHSCVFDFSVWEMWGALLHGGKLVVIPKAVSRAPDVFAEWVARLGITVLNQTPSAFKQFAQVAQPHRLRYIIFGGEALDIASVQNWFARFGEQQPQLINMYGITETTVHVTYQKLSQQLLRDRTAAPIGTAIRDLSMYVLDEWLNPVPDGMIGELFVAGAGVAGGYHNRPELTAERFLSNPFSTYQDTLYRSGDLVKVDNKGELIYQGRADHQVKIRGFRIELGEIEAALMACDGVAEALVLSHQVADQPPQLVAYVVADASTVKQLRGQLETQLPQYMIPAFIMPLPQFPLTINGKIDRRALPEPELDRATLSEAFVAPRNNIELALSRVWQQVLGVNKISVHDNFFALGGDSLRAVQANELLAQQGIMLPLAQVFKTQQLAALAEYIRDHDSNHFGVIENCQPFSLISAEQRETLAPEIVDAYPLSGMQAGMFYHMMLAPDANIYHCTGTSHIRLDHRLDQALFYEAVQELVAHHEILRTGFDLHNDHQPIQCVFAEAELPVVFTDISDLHEQQQEAAILALIEQEKSRPFELMQPTLLRFFIQERSDTSFQFTMTECHPIFDGWSYHSLIVDVFNRYAEKLGRKPVTQLPQLHWRYADFVATEQAISNNPHSIAFWQQYLADFEPLALPLKSDAMAASKQLRAVHLRIEDDVYVGLKKLMQAANVPLKSILLAGHIKAMSLMTGQQDILTGIPTNGRYEGKGGDKQYGLFINTLPFRQVLSDGSWEALIQGTFALECDLIPHRRFPLSQVQRLVGREQALLEDVLFNYMDFHVYETLCPELGLEVERNLQTDQVHEGTNFALTVHFQHLTLSSGLQANDISLQLDYDSELLSAAQVRALGELYLAIFAAMATSPQQLQQDFDHPAIATCRAQQLAQQPGVAAAPVTADIAASEVDAALVAAVKQVWQDLLQQPVDETDNFFAAGGHSLLFLPLLTQLKALAHAPQFNADISHALAAITTLDLINYPSIVSFCQFISAPEVKDTTIKRDSGARSRLMKLRNSSNKRA